MNPLITSVQGENVKLAFIAAAATWAAIQVNDASGAVRTIQPYERLIIDSVDCQPGTATLVYLSTSGTIGGTGLPTSTSLLEVFGSPGGGTLGPVKSNNNNVGKDVPLGITPTILSSNSFIITLTGTGRIINGSTQGTRPNWREKLTASGNF